HQFQGNNRTVDNTSIRVTFPPLPNLQVTALTPPTEPTSGSETIVSWVVTNNGTGPTSAPYWYDHVKLSLNTVWGDGDDVDMGYVVNPNYLSVGESYTNSRTISIPKGFSGDYYILVKTDTFDNVEEDKNEGDNVLSTPEKVRFLLTPPPDLRVQRVEADNIGFSGENINVSWTVVNDDRFASGRTLEAGWNDRVIMSSDDVLGNADDRNMGDFWHIGTGAGQLEPGESYQVTKSIKLPIGVVGEHYFFVITDVNNHVYEHGFEFNNFTVDMLPDDSGPEPTTILLTPPPDLEVMRVTTGGSALAGNPFSVTWQVGNFGAEATRNNYWVDRVYLSLDGTLDGADILLGERGHSGALSRYEEDADGNPVGNYAYTTTASFTLPFGISGNYRVIVKTDAGNQVFEGLPNPSDPFGENNNTAASANVSISSQPADLVVSRFDAPATGEAGRQVSLGWTVSNVGVGSSINNLILDRVYVSYDEIFGDEDDIFLDTISRNGVVPAGTSYDKDASVTLPLSLVDGTYWLYVRTDATGGVYESNEDNNIADRRITVTRRTADLEVTDVGHATSATAGQTLAVDWRVQNEGTSTTNIGYWYDAVYLSLDQTLDGSDIELGARYRNSGLAPGLGYDAAGNFQLPSNLATNDYFIIVRTDRDNQITEGAAGELNNLRASTGTVHITAAVTTPPDLVVVSVDAPDTAISGQTMQVSWTVRNDGTGPADNRAWYDAVYLSRDGVLDRNADIYLGYASRNGLGVGESYTQTLDLTVPLGQSGPFYVFVVTDGGRAISESDEFNNATQDAAFTQVSLAPPADLVVGTITLPENGVPGRSATIGFSINNNGTNPALGSWSDSVYLSLDEVWDINDALFGVAQHNGTVVGGASYSNSVTGTLPGVTPGNYHVIVRSDIRNHIPESNEANNIGGSLDTVELDVDALTMGVASNYTLATGQAVYYKFTVGEGETVRLALDSVVNDNANELYVRYGSMPTRGQFDFAAREGFTADPQLVIPTTQAGTYYVMAYGQHAPRTAAAPDGPAFSILAQIIPFSITDVDARIVSNAGDVTLRIQGAKFGDNTDFSLVDAAGNRIHAHAIQLDNSSNAYATFSLFQAALGSYTVVADQLGTLADGSTGILASTSLVDAVTVRESLEADGVYLNIAGPTDVMVNRTNLFTLNYVNDGGEDVMAPLIIFESTTATPIGLSATSMHTSPVQILAASYDGPMDILRPGARYSVPMVFQSGGTVMSLDMRAGRIMADDIRLITDWDTIEASVRPVGSDQAEWDAFWGRVQPLIGVTWGEYVTVLNSMMLQVSQAGEPVRDVRDIFARMMVLNPDYVPYAAMSGELHDSVDDAGVADVQMAAYLVHDDGRLEHKGTTITDDTGHFSFARLMPGTYKIVAVGRALDMDRNGQLDLTAPQFTLGHTAPGSAGTIYVQPLAGIGASNDSNPVLDRDANGVTHMVWTRDGIVWHAWYDLATRQWKDAQAISTGESFAPAMASSGQLFHDAANQTTAGTVIAWQQGRGNASEIWYAVARAKAGGGFEWSAPVQLTSDTTVDVAPEVIIGDTGLVMITHLKRDGDIQDDTDIYYDIFAMSEADFTWPAAAEPEAAVVELAAADTALDTEGVSVAYGRQWKFGPWDFFGTEAEIVLALSGQVSEADCKATLGAQGQISGSFKGSSIRSTISGNGNVAAEWSVNEAAKDWQFNSAKAGWGASAQFDWRYGLSTLLSKIPHPAVTSAYLSYSLAVALAEKVGLTFEDGITFGGGASFTGMEWTLTQPFPDFVWPESIAEASLSGTLGVYAQLDAGPDSVRLQGDITVTVDIAPEVQLKSITGNITLSGNLGWFTFNEVFSISFYSASGLETADGAVQTQDASGPIFDPGSLLGSTALYGTNHVVANAGSDVAIDSAVSMARDGSVLFGAWTHMADPNVEIGSDILVAEYAGAWATPAAIAGARGLNSDATAAVDAQGRRMVLWTHADSSGLNGSNLTLENYEAALDSNNVVFATYDELTGSWSAMQTLAVTEGMDTGLTIGHDAAGNIVASWVRKGLDTLDHLMTATWNGSGWSGATEVAVGASIMDPAIEQLGDGIIVMWEQDGDPDPDASDFTLHYSIFTGGAWSAGALFDPIAMATGLALSAGVPVSSVADTSLDTQGLFPPFPVPEECLKCKPEEIKRIRESAPVCRDGGGTQVTFDSKTCTEKTIVYRPCVVRPRDPNDIIGPEGYGDEGWVAASSNLGYMIRFENAADATAPAQEVVITQQLDADLDWRTFRVDDFGFGDQLVEVDGKSGFYQKRLDFTADPTRGYFLDVSASVDISTGIVTWKLTTIDPATGDVPQEASVGFLPVNDTVYDENHDVVTQGTGRGEGFVTYTVKALRSATTGTVIDAQALIVFDTEEPIETPAISNMLDAVDPESAVIAFATSTTASREIDVRWSGQDDAEGSGVRDYSVWVSVNGGSFEVWLVDTELTEAIYIGEEGNTYSFYTTARDNADNEEARPTTGDASITVSSGTGSLSGTKFEDFDGDGVRDAGETGLAGWTIYLDADDDSVLDAGEISTVTQEDGSYSFIDLDPGSYTVREVAQAGWLQTTPSQVVSVVSGAATTGIDLGNFALAQIGGQVFSDTNANGVLDDGETGLAGWTLTLDQGSNGSIEATTTTDAYGFYRFTGVGPGVYTVLQVSQAGWLQTGPAGGSHTAQPTSGEDIGSKDFANVAAARISGTKFEDTNGNGQRDAGERGLAGW
ncbi:MAG: pre-peptidase C-terminal domain-containing protein, partial [Rhodoferax sp.]|nr:pre-peptidase C-terminal domain-containing protein [Rhodoferax sp.]